MSTRLALLCLILPLAALLSPTPVAAQQPEPELVLGFQTESSVGEELVIAAYLIDPAGNPINDEIVSFNIDAKFMNVLWNVDIGSAETKGIGLALLAYTPKQSGDHTVTATFGGNDVFMPAKTREPLVIAPGPETFVQPVPYRIPLANVITVVIALTTIWAVYAGVMMLFLAITRADIGEGSETESSN